MSRRPRADSGPSRDAMPGPGEFQPEFSAFCRDPSWDVCLGDGTKTLGEGGPRGVGRSGPNPGGYAPNPGEYGEGIGDSARLS
jgi:hypothetical protein